MLLFPHFLYQCLGETYVSLRKWSFIMSNLECFEQCCFFINITFFFVKHFYSI